MIDDQTFLGIPMARRKNRRWLVAITYALALACEAAASVSAFGGRASGMWEVVWTQVGFMAFFVPWVIFSRRITTNIWGMRRHRIADLGLARGGVEVVDPDEREMMVENAAYRKAYWVVVCIAFTAIFVTALRAVPLGSVIGLPLRPAIVFLVTLLLIVAFTLPQAIILWTEPDVPEDGARALPS